MNKEKLFQVGVKALIINSNDQILLLDSGDWHLKHQKRHWDIPGGRIKEGDTALETLEREVQEETGIKDINNPAFYSAVISNFEIPLNGYKIGLILMIYKVKIPSDSKIILSEEHAGFEWAGREEAAKRLAYKYPKEFTGQLY